MKNNYILGLLFLFTSFTFAQTQYRDGIIVLNEGGAGTESASLSFINANSELTNNIFGLANNGQALGKTGQDLAFHGDIAIAVLNMSHKIEILNATTFQKIATIDQNLVNPRYVAFHNNKAYVTCWGDASNDTDFVAVINLDSYTIESTFIVDTGIEKIVEHQDKLYILHKGGFSTSNKLSIYDINTGAIQEITVGDVPSAIEIKGNFAYILTNGLPSWGGSPTQGNLQKLNLTTLALETLVTFPIELEPSEMGIYGDDFYISGKANIYKYNYVLNSWNGTPYINTGFSGYYGIYGMSIVDDKIYVADAGNFVSAGKAAVYNLAGIRLNLFTVGSSPRSFHKAKSSTAGIDKPSIEKINAYPNPVSDRLFLSIDEEARVVVYDFVGKVIYKGIYTADGIDVSNFAKGAYILEVQQNVGKQNIRFIKK